MMFLLTCDKKLTKSQLSPTHASTKRKITDELKQLHFLPWLSLWSIHIDYSACYTIVYDVHFMQFLVLLVGLYFFGVLKVHISLSVSRVRL